MLTISLDYLFFIVPSVFSNVYLNQTMFWRNSVYLFCLCYCCYVM